MRLFFLAMSLLAAFGLPAWAEDAPPQETLVPQASPAAKEEAPARMVNLNLTRALTRIEELSRRLGDVERGLRYQDDRLRDLDREVNDLQRDRNR